MSDQYVKLEEERRHRQRLEKDKRKRKKRERERRGARRHSSLHTESDEDITPAQRVDIVTEEMPEVSRGPAWRAGRRPSPRWAPPSRGPAHRCCLCGTGQPQPAVPCAP